MTLAPWTDTELDRMVAEADRRTDEAWAEYRAEKHRRLAELDRMHERRISPHSVASGLTMFAWLLWMGTLMMAFAGLLAVL